MNANNIPAIMRELDHWVLWKKEFVEGKNGKAGRWAKIPYQINGRMAKSNDPSTWTSFSNALKCLDHAKYNGLGFQFAGSGLVGIDIDNCIENGWLTDHAQRIMNQCNSYTEKSPSGIGIHVIVKGTIPNDINKPDGAEIEMYGHERYFTVTGDKLSQYDIEPRQDVLNQLHQTYAKKEKQIDNPANPQFWDKNDNDILQRAFTSANGSKIKALYDGDMMSAYGDDHSRADQALCNYLAFWLDKDFNRIDQAFIGSRLYRDKWDREDYKKWTIDRAIAGCAQSVGTPPRMTAAEAFAGEDFSEFTTGGRSGPSSLMDRPDSMLRYLNVDFQPDRERHSIYKDRKTGFSNLDRELNGLYPGLYVVGGISSVGKTTFIHQLADQLAGMGDHIIYFSLEQSRLELASKSLSRLTMQQSTQQYKQDAVSGISVRTGNNSESVQRAIETYKETAQRVNVIEGNFNTTAPAIRAYVEQYIKDNGVRPIVVIDYLQILQGDPHLGDKQRIDSTVTELKRMTRDHNITLFVISSLNRGNYLTPIDFESFKESGSIEYTCDVLWGLQLDAINDPIFNKEGKIKEKRELIKLAKLADPRRIELVCLKNRNGKSSFTCGFTYYPRNDLFVAEAY